MLAGRQKLSEENFQNYFYYFAYFFLHTGRSPANWVEEVRRGAVRPTVPSAQEATRTMHRTERGK